ncbi:DUF951 domain-containing protein [Hydrogenibacillus schlegelii]|uniref:DUF951 domain-containing protein n=1 Tax=Hydrogenibacillus schlegelii TaxID=1484 RepID=A0A132N2C3_HYDSH|nr:MULTISPECIES: DUF951 domain-containing protein [Hydrogenibacillus]KWX04288.1 hypothetical protein TR75_08375 [Hydrogenibacillus schlegelii]MBE3563310.1 DUF951 domain-containing protein [Hydrogenibacillus schlegelii]MBT9282118.1 DUF951 domain-containing protein [Hydrogenibacillus schlegelii]OAR04156.1 hypothetical protein SA87_06770 [Hydrogenibacillus schlegelii]PTQ54497.1 MAG: protein involved in chromosome partitioning [Hydrogenibacillus schlegelii]
MRKDYDLGDVVELKKPHPCGTNAWTIVRMGMDIRLKCTGCGATVLFVRSEFERRLRRVLKKATPGA